MESIVLAPNKDTALRISVEHGKVNPETSWDSYPILHVDRWINSRVDVTIFSNLVSNSGYLQVEISMKIATKPFSRRLATGPSDLIESGVAEKSILDVSKREIYRTILG